MSTEIRKRLEYLRGELRAARISWGELSELQGLVEHITPGDVELLEAAGVPEFPASNDNVDRAKRAEIGFRSSPHNHEGNDDITNLYDFVCDLLHYADTIDDPGLSDRREEHGETNGSFVAYMALYHYDAELQEEAEENELERNA